MGEYAEYNKWISEKLLSLYPEIDLDVFVQYIISILETEIDEEEVVDSISGFLQEICVRNWMFLVNS